MHPHGSSQLTDDYSSTVPHPGRLPGWRQLIHHPDQVIPRHPLETVAIMHELAQPLDRLIRQPYNRAW
jgi:hypothetical protein